MPWKYFSLFRSSISRLVVSHRFRSHEYLRWWRTSCTRRWKILPHQELHKKSKAYCHRVSLSCCDFDTVGAAWSGDPSKSWAITFRWRTDTNENWTRQLDFDTREGSQHKYSTSRKPYHSQRSNQKVDKIHSVPTSPRTIVQKSDECCQKCPAQVQERGHFGELWPLPSSRQKWRVGLLRPTELVNISSYITYLSVSFFPFNINRQTYLD